MTNLFQLLSIHFSIKTCQKLNITLVLHVMVKNEFGAEIIIVNAIFSLLG